MKRSSLFADRLSAVQKHESAVPEAEAVHQMRVASRRLRAALRVLRLRGLDPGVKKLQDALGEVRDLQLEVEWLDGRDATLTRSRRARLRKAEQTLVREMKEWRSRTLPVLIAFAGTSRPPPAKVAQIIRKRLGRLDDRLERARRRESPASFHQARIAVKQVRYLLEVADGAVPKKASRLEQDLKTLQAALGQLHDLDVRIALVKKRPALLREASEERARVAKIVEAQLARWHQQHLVRRTRHALR